MQDRARPLMAWMAILAVALQAVFGGVAAAPAMAVSFDPTAIICHNGGADSDADRQAPVTSHDCCTYCILGSPLSAAAAPDSFATFAPSPRRTASFIPFSAVEPTPLGGLAIHLARGPPRGI